MTEEFWNLDGGEKKTISSALPSKNEVIVNGKKTSYYRIIDGKKYSFVGSFASKQEGQSLLKRRKQLVPEYNNRLIYFNGRWLYYTSYRG